MSVPVVTIDRDQEGGRDEDSDTVAAFVDGDRWIVHAPHGRTAKWDVGEPVWCPCYDGEADDCRFHVRYGPGDVAPHLIDAYALAYGFDN